MVYCAMQVKHGRGYVYAIEYHIVWCVKYRHAVLSGQVAETLRELLNGVADEYGFGIESLEVVPDHVHVLVSATPQQTIPTIVKMLKGISARRMFQRHPELKERLWGGHLWNPSYYVGTIGESNESQVRAYIEGQNAKGV